MNTVRVINAYSKWRLAIVCKFFFLFSAYFSGCVVFTKTIPDGNGNSKLFHKSYNDTWNAAISALEITPLAAVDKNKGLIKTEWVEVRSGKEAAGLFFVKHWKERYRLLISVISMSALDKSTEVSIIVHAEERAPAGIQAFNWQRKTSNGTIEINLLEKIEQLLLK